MRRTAPTRITNLRCEYRTNPLGLGEARPRLFWQMASDRRGARQTAWRVTVSSEPGGKPGLWNSGIQKSDTCAHVVFGGSPLPSRARAWWRVQVWDELGKHATSGESWWETGLLQRADWNGRWIGAKLEGGARSFVPAPFLRRSFTLPTKPVRARLYVTALGLHECWINGSRVSDDALAPGWTDYRKRVYHQTYDVTSALRKGGNVVGAILGSGWYCGHVGWRDRQLYGDQPKLLAQLEVACADGCIHQITTDEAWRASFGPILDEDLMMGESYDARREVAGWCDPSGDDAKWESAAVFPEPGAVVEPQPGASIRPQEELTPIAEPVGREQMERPVYIFDLGQNITGRVRIRVRETAGVTLRIRHAEMLAANGDIYTENLRSARATDHYTCKGGGLEEWEPRFTFHGFRYVEIKGLTAPPRRDAVTGIVLHTDLARTGEFSCSDLLVNQLQKNIDWGLRGNFLDVPTDCPQRDERLGWTGDAQVFIRTAAFNRDVASFFGKWQHDLADAQDKTGAVPPIAPNTGAIDRDGGPAWSDAIVICPWIVYRTFGDTALLRRHFDSLCRFVDSLERDSDRLIRVADEAQWQGFGDWLALDGSGRTDGGTRKDLIGTAFFAHSADLLARIATIIERPREAARYRRLFERVSRAFQKRFLTPDGLVAAGTQTACVLTLHFDLAPPSMRARIAQELAQLIQKNGDRLATGFVGSPYLPHVLSDHGLIDVAYRLLHQTKWPSWLYAVTQGATTIWERWDGWTDDKGFQSPGMNSFNHYAYGAIGDWLYTVVAGLDLAQDKPAGARLRIHPRPGGHITSARARWHTLHGTAECAWEKPDDNTFTATVTVPPNSTAEVILPARKQASIRVNGQKLRTSSLLRMTERSDRQVFFEAASGTWQFIVADAGSSK
ncbi:MAG: family 78 glycoside hydrolase catalytic domain [Opitutaceae bacterium]